MTEDCSTQIQIRFPKELRNQLDQICNETTLSINNLAVISLYSLLSSYEDRGDYVFSLLNLEKRKNDYRTTIRVPVQVKAQLEAVAQKTPCSSNQLVVESLLQLTKEYKRFNLGIFSNVLFANKLND